MNSSGSRSNRRRKITTTSTNLFKITISFLLFLQSHKTASPTPPTKVLLFNQASYTVATGSLQDNPLNLKYDLTDFISSRSDRDPILKNLSPVAVSRLKILPFFSSTTRMFYTFEANTLFFIKYDIVQLKFDVMKNIDFKSVYGDQAQDLNLQYMECLGVSVCIFEANQSKSPLTHSIFEVGYNIDLIQNEIIFNPSVIFVWMLADFQEKENCQPKFSISDESFIRFCEEQASDNVLIFNQFKGKKIIAALKLSAMKMTSVKLRAMESYLSVYYRTDDEFHRYTIDIQDTPKDEKLASSIVSYFSTGLQDYYFIDSAYDLYYAKDRMAVEMKYHISQPCAHIFWISIDDIFFLCLIKSDLGSFIIKIYLANQIKTEQIAFDDAEFLGIVPVPHLQRLAVCFKDTKTNQNNLVNLSISKVIVTIKIPETGTGGLDCEYYMDECTKYDLGQDAKTFLSLYYFTSEESYDQNRLIDLIFSRQELSDVDWKYVQEDNYVKIDDYITGYSDLTVVNPIDDFSEGLLEVKNEVYNLNLLSFLQFSISSFDIASFEFAGLLSSKDEFITYNFISTIGSFSILFYSVKIWMVHLFKTGFYSFGC